MKLKSKKLVFGVLAILVILAGLAAFILAIPSAARQLQSGAVPLLVAVSHPANGSSWPADTPIPVEVSIAAGAPIKNAELWIDGRLFDTHYPKADRQRVYKVWTWMPLTEGIHTIFVRATDINGRTADSNAVHIQATSAAGMLGVLIAKGGETVQSLADQNGLTPEQILAANPTLDPDRPIAPGTKIFIPGYPSQLPAGGEAPAAPPGGGPSVPAEEGGPSGLSVLVERIFTPDGKNPAAPSVTASAAACDVTLAIQDHSDNEDGFFVYALSETATSFEKIAGLKAHSGTGALQYILKAQHGSLQFYASAYNAAGETPGAPAAVNVTDPKCNLGAVRESAGGLVLENGILKLPQEVQLVYLYASVDHGAWKRIPGEHDFMIPVSRTLDLRATIETLSGAGTSGEIDLDVWGWSAGALVHLGEIHKQAEIAELTICDLAVGCMGDSGQLHWKTEAVVDPDLAPSSRKLEWTATGSGITHGIWQVSSQPFPAEYSVGAPPGLLISGISEATYHEKAGLTTGEFTIDFKYDLQYTGSGYPPPATATPTTFWNAGRVSSTDSALFSDLAGIMKFSLPAALPRILYIRVTPIAEGHPAPGPSNSVRVTVEPSAAPPPIHISQVPAYAVEIVPGSYVNEVQVVQEMGIMGCSTITAVDHDALVAWYQQAYAAYEQTLGSGTIASMAEQAYQYYADHIGQTVCPNTVELPEDTILEQIGQAFESWWNSLSSALEGIKGTLVDAIASIIPGCDSTCKSVLMTGLNFTITYFTGLPPSLPDFDGMVDMGIEYAVQVAIAQSGIPYCDSLCQEKISGEIKDLADEVAHSGKSQPGCASDNALLWLYEGTQLYHLKPLCFPPGVSFEPVKGSMYERGMVQVKVTRIDGSPAPAGPQQLILDTKAVNDAYGDGRSEPAYFQMVTWENCQYVQGYQNCVPFTHNYNYTMVYSLSLMGVPYPQKTIMVPALKAGQSLVIPVVFESNPYDYAFPNVYPARSIAIAAAFPGLDLSTIPVQWWRDFLHLTGSGARITIDARVLCEDKAAPSVWNSPCSSVDTEEFIVP